MLSNCMFRWRNVSWFEKLVTSLIHWNNYLVSYQMIVDVYVQYNFASFTYNWWFKWFYTLCQKKYTNYATLVTIALPITLQYFMSSFACMSQMSNGSKSEEIGHVCNDHGGIQSMSVTCTGEFYITAEGWISKPRLNNTSTQLRWTGSSFDIMMVYSA